MLLPFVCIEKGVHVWFESTSKFRTAQIRFLDIIPRSRVDPFPVTGSNLVGVDLSFRSLTYPSSIQSFSSFVPKLGLSLLSGLFRSPIRIVP